MVALGFSIAALVLCLVATFVYADRRPVGTPVTWGEGIAGAVFVFFIMFLIYGIIPHQWLTYAGNELGWRTDKFVEGPNGIVADALPFRVTYAAVMDTVAALIYIVGLGGNIALWALWQNRGKVKPKELPRSAYGRPLLKPVEAAEA